MHDLPTEMLTSGRPPDNIFKPDEQFFVRVAPNHFVSAAKAFKRLALNAFPVPDMSVNRSGEAGEPRYVLCNVYQGMAGQCDGRHHTWGVAAFNVKIATHQIRHGRETLDTRPIHKPLRYNYYHTEIQAFDKHGNHIGSDQIKNLAWEATFLWRRYLRDNSQIVIEPSTDSSV